MTYNISTNDGREHHSLTTLINWTVVSKCEAEAIFAVFAAILMKPATDFKTIEEDERRLSNIGRWWQSWRYWTQTSAVDWKCTNARNVSAGTVDHWRRKYLFCANIGAYLRGTQSRIFLQYLAVNSQRLWQLPAELRRWWRRLNTRPTNKEAISKSCYQYDCNNIGVSRTIVYETTTVVWTDIRINWRRTLSNNWWSRTSLWLSRRL